MSSACTPILVGMAFSISEIMLLSKAAKFSLRTMDYYVTSMDTNLVGGASPVSEILLPSKKAKFPFLTMDYMMSQTCTPILVGVASFVSERLVFPF